jgi:hypothetical protein
LAVWLVADFEALSYQVTTTFDTSCTARIRTAPAINYTACYLLAFFSFYSQSNIFGLFNRSTVLPWCGGARRAGRLFWHFRLVGRLGADAKCALQQKGKERRICSPFSYSLLISRNRQKYSSSGDFTFRIISFPSKLLIKSNMLIVSDSIGKHLSSILKVSSTQRLPASV